MGQAENVLGTLLLGIFFNTYLYGVVSFQYFSYFSGKITDALSMKAVVALLFANDTFQSALMIFMGWEYCVRNFVNPVFMNYVIWPYAYVPIGTAITAVATHLPLASRIYFMSKKKWICVLLFLGSLGSLGTGFALGIIVWTSKDLHRADRLLKTLAAVWLGIQAALDVVLAVLSTIFLHNHSKGADQKTSSVINRLILGAVQAGVVPVLFGAAALATFFGCPKTDLFIMFIIPLGRTYTIAFVNGLNVREALKERLLGSPVVDAVVTDVVFHHAISTPTFPPAQEPPGPKVQKSRKSSKGSLQITTPIIVHSPKAYQNLWDGEPLRRSL